MTGPLSNLPPFIFDAGPFGRLAANGILSGIGLLQNNHTFGSNSATATLSNGQMFLQKIDGILQFYLQVGAYSRPALGASPTSAEKTTGDLYDYLPVAYLKLQPDRDTSLEIGKLPSLVGSEYFFTFQNMNIERGLLWSQDIAISRGIQLNRTMGHFGASLSWNDGFYSNRYTWLSGALSYTDGPHSLAFVGAGNYGQTGYITLATPIQNNGRIYDTIYSYTRGAWLIRPYWQHSTVATDRAGIQKNASTNGGAILVSRAFKNGFAMATRWEYINTSGNPHGLGAIDLFYGVGSSATSITLTPTFQHGAFFFRGEFSYVHAADYKPGSFFGPTGFSGNQTRAGAELGFIFGHNLIEVKKP